MSSFSEALADLVMEYAAENEGKRYPNDDLTYQACVLCGSIAFQGTVPRTGPALAVHVRETFPCQNCKRIQKANPLLFAWLMGVLRMLKLSIQTSGDEPAKPTIHLLS